MSNKHRVQYRQFKDTIKPDPMWPNDYDVYDDAIQKAQFFLDSQKSHGQHIIDIDKRPIYTRLDNADVQTNYRIVTVVY